MNFLHLTKDLHKALAGVCQAALSHKGLDAVEMVNTVMGSIKEKLPESAVVLDAVAPIIASEIAPEVALINAGVDVVQAIDKEV